MRRGATALLAVVLCAVAALAAAQNKGTSAGATRAPKGAAKPPGAPAPATPVAQVNGDVIQGKDFDALLGTYLRQSREQAKKFNQNFGKNEERLVASNVLSGLINDRLWVQEANRNNIAVQDSTVDNKIRQDAFFQTGGRLDETKFQAFKVSPQSNYKEVFRRARDIAMVDRLRGIYDKRFTPDEKKIYDEYVRQNQKHRMRWVWVRPDPGEPQPEPPASVIEAYYNAHVDDYKTPDQAGLLFACYKVGTKVDTSWEQSRLHSEELLRKLRAGAQLDSDLAAGATRINTGLIDRGKAIGILNHGPSLTDSLFLLAPKQPYEKVVLGKEGYGVLVLSDRRTAAVRPLKDRDVYPRVASRATTEYREKEQKDREHRLYENSAEHYRTRAVNARALYFDPRSFLPQAAPTAAQLHALYDERLGSFAFTDSAGKLATKSFAQVETTLVRMVPTWIADSLSDKAEREAWNDVRRGRDVFARPVPGVTVRQFINVTPSYEDTVLGPALVDSLLTSRPGHLVRMPAASPGRLIVRVESVDTAYVPSFEQLRGTLRSDVTEARNKERESAARAYYLKHKGEFLTGTQYTLGLSLIPRVDAVDLHLSDADTRLYYNQNIKKYTTEEQFHLKAIVLNVRPNSSPAEVAQYRARADSIALRLKRGEDFAALARQYTMDSQSAKLGGDMGVQTPSSIPDTAVSNAARRAKVGEITGPVRGIRGFYILRVEERTPQVVQPLDKIHDVVYRALVMDRGDEAARKAAADLMGRLKTFDELSRVASKSGGDATVTDPFEIGDEIPGIGSLPGIKAALPRMKAGQFGAVPEKGLGGYYAWMLREIIPPAPAPFEKVIKKVMERMDKDSANARVQEKLQRLQARLKDTDNLADAAYDLGVIRDTGPFVRGYIIVGLGAESLVDSFVARAKPGQISGPIAHPNGGYFVGQYLGPDPIDKADFESRKAQIRDQLLDQPEREILAGLRKRAKVKILRAELKDAWQAEMASQGGAPSGAGGPPGR